MATDPSMKNSPFPGLKFAGPQDDLEDLLMEIALGEDWLGYMNQRVLTRLNELHPGRLAFMRFLPDLAEGQVIMVPAASEQEYGAVEIKYVETENAAQVNLRRALKPLKVKKMPGRVRVFQLVERVGADKQTYLAFVVKDAETRPSVKRSSAASVTGSGETGKQA